jgi:hypothetical protein
MGRAKQSAARLIDQRARRRATQALIDMHREEFRDLYQFHRMNAATEARVIAEAATRVSNAETKFHPSGEPPRLMSGRYKPGQDATDRIDVARCPHCVKHHDRGHVCTKCGARPTTAQPAPSALSLAKAPPAGLHVPSGRSAS